MKKISIFLSVIVSLVMVLAGCGSQSASSPSASPSASSTPAPAASSSTPTQAASASPSKANITIWDIQTGSLKQIMTDSTDQFNKSQDKVHADLQFYSNDNYKQKIQIAMAANTPPDIIMGWGGGVLKTYVDANKVVNLDKFLAANPDFKNKFFPGVWGNVTFNGHIYGVPDGTGTQPELIFYNKTLFSKYSLSAPKTWDDMLKDVAVFKSKGIIPISLGARDKWPDLMWLSYLVDRIGGPQVFQNILANKKDAWSDPAVLEAATKIQDLVKAGAFGKSYSSVSANSNQDQALLYSGKAAMMLQGDWVFPTIKTSAPKFTSNDLAWTTFPTVAGGKGDPRDLSGNISDYYYVSATSKNAGAAEQYLLNVPLNNYQIDQDIKTGTIPPVKGIADKFKGAPDSDFLTSVYNIAEQAPVFVTGWDQLLPPSEAQVMLNQLSALFLNAITPQQFVDNMNKAIPNS